MQDSVEIRASEGSSEPMYRERKSLYQEEHTEERRSRWRQYSSLPMMGQGKNIRARIKSSEFLER